MISPYRAYKKSFVFLNHYWNLVLDKSVIHVEFYLTIQTFMLSQKNYLIKVVIKFGKELNILRNEIN